MTKPEAAFMLLFFSTDPEAVVENTLRESDYYMAGFAKMVDQVNFVMLREKILKEYPEFRALGTQELMDFFDRREMNWSAGKVVIEEGQVVFYNGDSIVANCDESKLREMME